MRLELMTSSLPWSRSTPELRGHESLGAPNTGAGDETRTRDPQLGRLMLYQLSYTRPNHFQLPISNCQLQIMPFPTTSKLEIGNWKSAILASGAGGRIRTSVGWE